MSAALDTREVIVRARSVSAQAMTPHHAGRMARWAGWGIARAALVAMGCDLGFSADRLLAGMVRTGHLLSLMWPPTSAGEAGAIFKALGQTIAMAFLGTALVTLCALPLGILGARTIVQQPVVHFLLRRLFDAARAIPALVWAMILVAAFGLGPRVGVTAIVLAETPYLAKLFAETMENRRRGVIESLQAAGVTPLQVLRYGLMPEVLPLMTGKVLLLFEANIRASAALGLVGAGGIGVLLDTRIQLLQLDQVAWILILFIALVLMIDLSSQALRRRLIHAKSYSLKGMDADA
jgi:phosphonate transport system permease protein